MTDEAKGSLATPVSPRDQVIAWLVEGHRESDIKEAIALRWPTQNPAALTDEAVEHFAQAAKCDAGIVVGWGMEAYRDLYRRMVAIGDFSNAMKAVKELVALAGKYCVRHSEEDEPTDDTERQQ